MTKPITDKKKKTWRELEATGVKRCCVHFKDGTRCKRRASKDYGYSWCSKHGPVMEAINKAYSHITE